MVRYPPLVLSFTQEHLRDTPFCYVSRDNCAIPHKNKHERVFAILSLQVSRDMKKYRCWASKLVCRHALIWEVSSGVGADGVLGIANGRGGGSRGANTGRFGNFGVFPVLSGTGDSQRDSRESIRANHSHC